MICVMINWIICGST